MKLINRTFSTRQSVNGVFLSEVSTRQIAARYVLFNASSKLSILPAVLTREFTSDISSQLVILGYRVVFSRTEQNVFQPRVWLVDTAQFIGIPLGEVDANQVITKFTDSLCDHYLEIYREFSQDGSTRQFITNGLERDFDTYQWIQNVLADAITRQNILNRLFEADAKLLISNRLELDADTLQLLLSRLIESDLYQRVGVVTRRESHSIEV